MKQQNKNQRSPQTNPADRKSPPPQPTANNRVHSAQPSSSVEAKPAFDEVRRRAYEIYLERQHTGQPGSPATDWEMAERELSARANAR